MHLSRYVHMVMIFPRMDIACFAIANKDVESASMSAV